MPGTQLHRSSPGGASGKEPACQHRRRERHRFDPWVGKILWKRKWQPTPVFLPGKSWTEEPGRLPSMVSQRVGPNLGTKLLPLLEASQMALVVKNPAANGGDIRDMGLIPRSKRVP